MFNNGAVNQKLFQITKTTPEVISLSGNQIVPVVVTNESGSAAEVQPALPRPNRKQKLLRLTYSTNSGTTNIAVPTANTRIYFLGFDLAVVSTSAASSIYIWDGSSGSVPGSGTSGTEILISFQTLASTTQNYLWMLPLPVECQTGIRLQAGAFTGGGYNITVYYIEEQVEPGDSRY
jgi:hypothetical protein